MSKVFFYGDSGNKKSALQAYRAAYRINLDEAYHLINERALKILETNYGVVLHQIKARYLNAIFNQVDSTLLRQLRRVIIVSHYYYEQAETTTSRLFRCFISGSLDEKQLLVLEHKLAESHYLCVLSAQVKEQA